MSAILLSMLLSAGPGASLHPGREATPGVIGGFFSGATVGSPRATMVAPRAGRLTGIHVERTTTGTALGEQTITVAVTADGVDACTLDIPCVGTGDTSGSCDATFESGQDIHLEISASSCLTPPAFAASAAWLW